LKVHKKGFTNPETSNNIPAEIGIMTGDESGKWSAAIGTMVSGDQDNGQYSDRTGARLGVKMLYLPTFANIRLHT
jgi:hypothetical protein